MKKDKSKFSQDHISLRTVNFDGIDSLWWVTVDKKAFSGPLKELISDHSKFLEYVKEKSIVVQAGGNCGLYARFYGNHFKQVYTFEPQADNFKCLTLNCQGDQYRIYNCGLGKDFRNVSLKHPATAKRSNMGVWQVVEDPSGDVQIITIDSLNLDRCDLIHLDIEGYEPNALLGAEQTITKFKPVLILEEGHGEDIAKMFGYKLVEKLSRDWIFLYE